MTKYRIIEKENKLGNKIFNVQVKKRIFFIFYFYDTIIYGLESLKSSKEKIDKKIFEEKQKEKEKFIKIKIHKYNGPIR